MARRRSRQAIFVVALIVVAWQSLVPSDDVLVRTEYDKAGHALVYAVLGALAAFAMKRPRVLPAWIGVVAFGLALEIAQDVSGYRSFEVVDLIADAFGSVIGAGIVVQIARRRERGTT